MPARSFRDGSPSRYVGRRMDDPKSCSTARPLSWLGPKGLKRSRSASVMAEESRARPSSLKQLHSERRLSMQNVELREIWAALNCHRSLTMTADGGVSRPRVFPDSAVYLVESELRTCWGAVERCV